MKLLRSIINNLLKVKVSSLEAYFGSLTIPTPPTTVTTTAITEQNVLFGGDLNNIDEWIKHEEFRLKKKKEDSERVLREENAQKAFWFSVVWAGFIVAFILLHGFKDLTCFSVTETEFLFVCGTLTTSLLAYYLLVIKYLFYRKSED